MRYVSTNVKFPLWPAMLDLYPYTRNTRASMTQLHVYVTLQHRYRWFIPTKILFTWNQHACYNMWLFFSFSLGKSTYLPVLLHLIIISFNSHTFKPLTRLQWALAWEKKRTVKSGLKILNNESSLFWRDCLFNVCARLKLF